MTREAFQSKLIELGFRQSTRNVAAYQKKDCGRFRFVFLERVVRLEEKKPGKGAPWHLNSSYLYSRQLDLAQWAAENCGSMSPKVERRKEVRFYWHFAIFLALGLALCAIGVLIARWLSGGETGPAGAELFFGVLASGLFVIGGLVLFVLTVSRWRDRQRFLGRSWVVQARVSGKGREWAVAGEGPQNFYYLFLTVRFRPAGQETWDRPVEIRARVGEEIHKGYLTGSTIMVRYAAADPRIAAVEGERFF